MKPRNRWKSALDPNGKMYYFHTGTKEVSWKKPMGSEVLLAEYLPDTGTLGSGNIIKIVNPTTVHVENYVVPQKMLHLQNSTWRVTDF